MLVMCHLNLQTRSGNEVSPWAMGPTLRTIAPLPSADFKFEDLVREADYFRNMFSDTRNQLDILVPEVSQWRSFTLEGDCPLDVFDIIAPLVRLPDNSIGMIFTIIAHLIYLRVALHCCHMSASVVSPSFFLLFCP